ncbi:P-loop containing nucleoside triphosphate hydrolase protein [Pseudomassariella vexata]|uniref:p-loop containing nucleoside triphosphate hydrolase protein n=1 Tax=Pseudomassariella vexata TaxID=1141098 RepID=A0A1Y2E7M5_9PEZI|nr:P-loop containing nucleoside triphosphate hydrolase protein [Pseudomassariella vexata]ORY67540.1 P-loop containing nucleoside triphosphate hydrolase protein [Pseudomassariella vexata]
MGGVPSKPGDPSRPLEVIGAGYSRTGTLSVQLALEKLLDGPVMHGGTHILSREDAFPRKWMQAYNARRAGDKELTLKLLRELTAGYVGITDLPGIGFIGELQEIYPEAKVLLVTRDPVKWWRSVEPVARNSTVWWLPYVIFPVPGWRWFPSLVEEWSMYARTLRGRTDENTVAGGPTVLEAHNKFVMDLVPNKDRLLVMELKEGWEPLARFLGKPVPEEPFPRANDADSAEQTAKKVFGKVLKIWVGMFTVAGVGVYAGRRLWKS